MKIVVTGGTGRIAPEVKAGVRRHIALSFISAEQLQGSFYVRAAASGRPGRPLDHPEIYTVRYRTISVQRELRAGDESFR